MAAKKWDMAAAVASHLVKVDPETAGWWIRLAYAQRLIRTANRLCEPGSMRLETMFDIVPRGSEWSLLLLPRPKRICYWLSLPQKAP